MIQTLIIFSIRLFYIEVPINDMILIKLNGAYVIGMTSYVYYFFN